MAASSLKTPMPTPKKANWSDLLVELLVSILTHSSSLEILRSSIVCSLWNKIIRDHESVLVLWIILPSKTTEADVYKLVKLDNNNSNVLEVNI
ncbi:hypothetical protein CUMW_142580 [Citrus unshiu]|nr:hypothetical protein CUMW_142580 [Citrus unshiu]